MGARRKARELALQMLFQHDMSGNGPDQIITTFEELQKSKPNTREFATKIFRGTVDHMTSIDEMIQNQAENWRLSRMAAVDRNIIRMSIYEFLHENDTPKLVIIDEAIEIAKKYGTQKSSQFINGILDGILKRYNLASDERSAKTAE
ncbi:MAG TPA: transcription antitermination factor NusB [Thermoanaerobaculia bacterium]|jgi:N utilization substance protein B|nr:transcription antitermination factor NusB [Thermoanaerobaculia bacterium]